MKKYFKAKYINRLNLDKENPENNYLQKLMDSKKEGTPRAYRYIVQLANEYNEKHNIPKRYEIPA
jgi:hypothetical protein